MLKLNPRMANTYCIRGVARLAQSKLEEAEAEITRCRELGKDLKSKVTSLLQEMKERRATR